MTLARRILRCFSVSIATTLLSATILVALAVGAGVSGGTANVIAVCCGILPSYFANRYWVWGRRGKSDVARRSCRSGRFASLAWSFRRSRWRGSTPHLPVGLQRHARSHCRRRTSRSSAHFGSFSSCCSITCCSEPVSLDWHWQSRTPIQFHGGRSRECARTGRGGLSASWTFRRRVPTASSYGMVLPQSTPRLTQPFTKRSSVVWSHPLNQSVCIVQYGPDEKATLPLSVDARGYFTSMRACRMGS